MQIYLITNKVNNKKYIGQAIDYQQRWKGHINDARKDLRKNKTNSLLNNAINKYGPDSFKLELIEDEIPEENIDFKEAFYINKYNTFFKNGVGYNMTLGGQGIHGYKHTDETKSLLSDYSLSWWKTLKEDDDKYKGFCKSRGYKHRGWKPSDETLQRMKDSAYERNGELNPFYGKNHTKETKQHLSEIKSIAISMVDKNGDVIREFKSGKEASKYIIENKEMFVNVSTNSVTIINSRINKVLQGKAKTAYGYIWKYI